MRHKAGLFLSFCLALYVSSYTQQTPPAALVSKFPFRIIHGGVIILTASLNHSADSIHFVFDTGSGGISLDSSLVAERQLKVEKSAKHIRGIGGIRPAFFVYNQQIQFDDYSFDSLDFHINDYSFLTSAYGIKIGGVIGFSLLKNYVVSLDYDNRMVSIYRPGKFKYPRTGRLLTPRIAQLVYQQAVLSEKNAIVGNYLFDTGAGLCLLLSEAFAADSAIFSSNKKQLPGFAEGIAGRQEMKITVIKNVRIAGYKFRNVPTYIFRDSFNIINYPNAHGLIGNDLLRRFNVIFNYPAGEIHLKPNSYFNSPFTYAYSGLTIGLENGSVIINDVIEGSPAGKAGLQKGDVILWINNTPALDFQTIKSMLQADGTTVNIVVRRGEELFTVKCYIADIR